MSRLLMAEADWFQTLMGLFIFLLLLAVGAIALVLVVWFAWNTFREVSSVVAPRSHTARRRNLRFGFPLVFGMVTATAVVSADIAIYRPAAIDSYAIVRIVFVWIVALCFFYIVAYALGDLAVSFGWIKPPGDLRRHLLGQRAPDPGRRLTQEDVERIEVPSEMTTDAKGPPPEHKKRRRRHWWAKEMPDRTRTYAPGKDYEIPQDRDEYAG